MIKVELFSATLKRRFPLLKQRAPTKLEASFLVITQTLQASWKVTLIA
jgi:hypothetical protein